MEYQYSKDYGKTWKVVPGDFAHLFIRYNFPNNPHAENQVRWGGKVGVQWGKFQVKGNRNR